MRLILQAALAAVLFTALWPVAAFAQAVTDPIVITEPTFAQELLTAVLPALGLVITAVLTFAANELRKRTGLDIEARHREALQSALLNGVLYALQRAGWLPGQPTDLLLASARSYVEGSVPDALKQFGIDAASDVGKATLDRLLTPKLPVPPGTVVPNGDKLIGRAE